uniref:(northern house mosquito) hypothetical protein n=1 Tax=Culex pipiens TaxID=7175 RepID=A0A8D8HZA7_CULPI
MLESLVLDDAASTFFVIIVSTSENTQKCITKTKRPALRRCVYHRENSLNGSNFTESTEEEGCVDIPYQTLQYILREKIYLKLYKLYRRPQIDKQKSLLGLLQNRV